MALTQVQGGMISSLPSGSVIQVIYGSTNTSTTTTVGPVDTTLTATITPKFSTSRIAVFIVQQAYLYNGGGDSGVLYTVLRNGSTNYSSSGQSLYTANSSGQPEIIVNFPINYVDSPATTSALTYKTQMQATAGSTVTAQWSGNGSTIILMEIAG